MPIVEDHETPLDYDREELYRCWSCAKLMEPQHYGRLCYECEALEMEKTLTDNTGRKETK